MARFNWQAHHEALDKNSFASAVNDLCLGLKEGRSFRPKDAAPTRAQDDKLDVVVSTAFRCLLKNRVQRGGILAPGAGLLKTGENGKGLTSRWYPETFTERIEKIQALRKRITFLEGDGLNIIASFAAEERAAFFIDPPYFANGRGPGERLYRHNEVDHANLFSALAKTCGPCLVTYHNSRPIRALAESHGFSCRNVRMKTTHHRIRNELLISKSSTRKPVISSSASVSISTRQPASTKLVTA